MQLLAQYQRLLGGRRKGEGVADLAGAGGSPDPVNVILGHQRNVEVDDVRQRFDVDAASQTVTAQPGVTLGELDAATQEHGLAVSVGIPLDEPGRNAGRPVRFAGAGQVQRGDGFGLRPVRQCGRYLSHRLPRSFFHRPNSEC